MSKSNPDKKKIAKYPAGYPILIPCMLASNAQLQHEHGGSRARAATLLRIVE